MRINAYHSLFILDPEKKKKISLRYNIVVHHMIHFDLLLFRYQCFSTSRRIYFVSCNTQDVSCPLGIFRGRIEKKKIMNADNVRDERSGETSFIRSFDFRQRICRVGCRDKVVVAGEIYWSHPRSWDA